MIIVELRKERDSGVSLKKKNVHNPIFGYMSREITIKTFEYKFFSKSLNNSLVCYTVVFTINLVIIYVGTALSSLIQYP